MSRLIDAEHFEQMLIDLIDHGDHKNAYVHHAYKMRNIAIKECRNMLWEEPTADAVPVVHGKWIPFKMRKPDPDELEDHPDWTYVLDGQLPDEGQRILVNCVFNGHEAVQLDEFYTDADGCYLDSGYEIGTEVSAWMPLPEPYKMDEVLE